MINYGQNARHLVLCVSISCYISGIFKNEPPFVNMIMLNIYEHVWPSSSSLNIVADAW